MKRPSVLFSLLLLVLLSSCSLQKRNYQRGYYIAWKKPHNNSDLAEKERSAINKIESMQKNEVSLLRSQQSFSPKMSIVNVKAAISNEADNCDTLILQNGTEVKAKVIEINHNEVKYKYCNNLNGPTIVVAKNDVRLIKYANGDKEEFTIAKAPSPLTGAQAMKDKYIQKQAQTALICGLLSFFILYFGIITAIIAIIKGSRALRFIGKDKTQYKQYYNMAHTGLILGIVYFCLILAIILLVLGIAFLYGLI